MSEVWYDAIGGEAASEPVWELYHDNSKTERHDRLHAAGVMRRTAATPPDFSGFPAFALGNAEPLNASLDTAMPADGLPMRSGRLPLKTLATLTSHAFAGADAAGFVEVYFHAPGVEELPAGLYRYDGARKSAQLLRRGELGREVAATLRDPRAISGSALQIFVIGIFDRAAAAEGERGYRSALMAAGAAARNVALAASTLGLGQGAGADFYDREIDALLALDGLARGTLYMLAVGLAAGA